VYLPPIETIARPKLVLKPGKRWVEMAKTEVGPSVRGSV
jgi:hypothetical protein